MARLGRRARIEAQASGVIAAVFESDSISLGKFGAAAAEYLAKLRTGMPLGTLVSGSGDIGNEFDLLVHRLAGHGLLEYRVLRPGNGTDDLAVIEPQIPGYWPQTAALRDDDVLALSRFAYMRRRGNEMVLESPCSSALFRICDPKLASLIAMLSTPQQIGQLRQQDGFPGAGIFALLVDCQIAFKSDTGGE